MVHWKYQRWDLADAWRRVCFFPFGLLSEHFLFLLFFCFLRFFVKISIDLSNPAITVQSSLSLSSSSLWIRSKLLPSWACFDTFPLFRPRCQRRLGISSCLPMTLTWFSLSSIFWVGWLDRARVESEGACTFLFLCRCWSFVWFSLQKQI